jgi:hypothetical protein
MTNVRPMPIEVLRRDLWEGTPKHLGDLTALRKNSRTAACQIWTHAFGWECRLVIGDELIASQVCRSQENVFTFSETWYEALRNKGWS